MLPAHGRLLIIEPVLPERVDSTLPALMYLSDLNMLVNVGGHERTETDFRALCQSAGLTVTHIHPLPPPNAFSVIEAAASRRITSTLGAAETLPDPRES